MASSTLIIIDRPPYGDWRGRDALDMAFSLAAFDQAVSILFRDHGVNWLRADQDGGAIHQKTVSNNLGAAGVFGVEALYADQTALETYGIGDTFEPRSVQPVLPTREFYQRFSHTVQL